MVTNSTQGLKENHSSKNGWYLESMASDKRERGLYKAIFRIFI